LDFSLQLDIWGFWIAAIKLEQNSFFCKIFHWHNCFDKVVL